MRLPSPDCAIEVNVIHCQRCCLMSIFAQMGGHFGLQGGYARRRDEFRSRGAVPFNLDPDSDDDSSVVRILLGGERYRPGVMQSVEAPQSNAPQPPRSAQMLSEVQVWTVTTLEVRCTTRSASSGVSELLHDRTDWYGQESLITTAAVGRGVCRAAMGAWRCRRTPAGGLATWVRGGAGRAP